MLVFASETYGSRRWIEVAGTQVQPSELTKLVLIIVLAKYFTDRQEKMTSPATFATSLAMTLLPMLLVFIEPDLGSAIILLAIWFAMVIVAGARSSHVLGLITMGLVALPFALIGMINDYQRERIATFLDPRRTRWVPGSTPCRRRSASARGASSARG